MLRNRIWIPIYVSVFVVVLGCGLFYGRKRATQAPAHDSARTQESGKAVYGPKFAEWFKKDVELRAKRRQVQQKLADKMSLIKVDSQTDEQFKRALNRVLAETEVEMGELERLHRAHQEKRPVAP